MTLSFSIALSIPFFEYQESSKSNFNNRTKLTLQCYTIFCVVCIEQEWILKESQNIDKMLNAPALRLIYQKTYIAADADASYNCSS